MPRAAILIPMLALPACAAGPTPEASEPGRRVTVSEEGGEVNVAITEDAPYPLNKDCTTYCDRLAECWSELPGADVMVSDTEARERCFAEREGCHTATTETLCCGYVTDCNAFAQCQGKGRGRVMTCQRRD